MAMKGTLLVKNHEGTELEGPRADKTSLIFEFDHEVYMPYDKEENRIQGSRRITAFTLTKDIDKLTPQLYQMTCLGQECQEVKVELYRISPEGGDEEVYFTYILENAKIVSVQNLMPSTKYEENENVGHLEKVKFLAKKFTWQAKDGGIEYTEESF